MQRLRQARGLALATLCTLLFLTFLDNTVVSVALGDLQVSLKASVTDLQWAASSGSTWRSGWPR